jgi:hypothetical protein
MSVVETAKTIYDLAKKGMTLEAQEMMMQLREEALGGIWVESGDAIRDAMRIMPLEISKAFPRFRARPYCETVLSRT